MTKKSIGIDIGRTHLRAVQIARTPEGFQIEKTFGIQTRRRTDSPVNILRALTAEHGFDRRAEVAVCLPHHAIFFADTEIDGATLQKLRAGDTSLLKDSFPIATDKAMVQICSTRPLTEDRYSVLAAATSSDLLEEELSLLGEGKLQPTLVETPITAANTAVAFNHPESRQGIALILCIEPSSLNLAVLHEGSLLMVRNIPMVIPRDSDMEFAARQVTDVLSREIEITWRKLFDAEPDPNLRVFLISESKTARYFAAAIEGEVNCQVTVADPYAKIDRAAEAEAEFPLSVAEGLALRKLLPQQTGGVNFLGTHNAGGKANLSIRKELAACAGLLAAIMVIWVGGLVLQTSRLESQYAAVKTEIESVFRETLPEEKNIVNPLAQIQQKLDAQRSDSNLLAAFQPGQMTPLDILSRLSTHQPSERDLRLNDVLIARDSVRVKGRCSSFSTLSEWQRLLEQIPEFDSVDLANPQMDAQTGQVHFTLSLSSRKAVQ